MPALTAALDRLQEGAYDGWLKIAVWHHPVAGKEMMNDEFMQLLAVHGFQVCLHGHIHEAIEGFHKYDDRRGDPHHRRRHLRRAGQEQVTGIPLQYNLLTFDPQTGEMTVQTREEGEAERRLVGRCPVGRQERSEALVPFPGAATPSRS